MGHTIVFTLSGAKMGVLQDTLQWCPNERDGVSNHQPHDSLLNCLSRRRSKKISKLRVTGLCEGNSPVTGEFPAQRVSNAEKIAFDDNIMCLANTIVAVDVVPCAARPPTVIVLDMQDKLAVVLYRAWFQLPVPPQDWENANVFFSIFPTCNSL